MPYANKRQRQSDEGNETSKAPPKAETPIRAAEAVIDTFVESLREEVRQNLTKKAKTFLKDYVTSHTKTETSYRIQDDPDFIPRSARFNFSIKSDKSTSELEEFQDLADETDEIVQETKMKLRAKIIKSLEIEVNNRIFNMITLLCHSANLCAKIAGIEQGNEIPVIAVTHGIFENCYDALENVLTLKRERIEEQLDDLFKEDENEEPTEAGVQALVRASELFDALFILPAKRWKRAKHEADIRKNSATFATKQRKQQRMPQSPSTPRSAFPKQSWPT